MSTEQKLCEVKIFQLQSMSNAKRCINQRFAFKNSRITRLALIFNFHCLLPPFGELDIAILGSWLRFFLISRKYRKNEGHETFLRLMPLTVDSDSSAH